MPPKPSPSQALTHRGTSGLANKAKAGGLTRTGKRGDDTPKTTTSVVLRGGRTGIWGQGEIQLRGQHYSGPQKLAYRANTLVTSGLLPPFQFSKLVDMAWAQQDMSLRTVEKLVDYRCFSVEMKSVLESRPEVALASSQKTKNNLLKDGQFIASTVAARIHNLFFIASSWRMIWTILWHMNQEGMYPDEPIRQQLQENQKLRTYFLALYDCINDIIQVGKQQVSRLTIASEYFKKYFVLAEGDQIAFSSNKERIREAHKSLLTTLMLELALEDSTYPIDILMSCLGDVINDAPKSKHRINQTLYDAIGDLSIAVDFRGQLDAALVGPDKQYRNWFNNDFLEGYKKYKKAIELSLEASEEVAKEIVPHVNPLAKTEKPVALKHMWDQINETYAAVAGSNIEDLWLLHGAWEVRPQWNTFFLPSLDNKDDSDDDNKFRRIPAKKKRAAPGKPRLAIANYAANEDSDEDLPELLDVSDSSDAESESSEEEEVEEDESDFDEDDEEQLFDLMREAEQYNFGNDAKTPEDIADNPFIRLMKGLKGRFATRNPISQLSTKNRLPDERAMKVKVSEKAKPAPAPKKTTAPKPQPGTNVTIEEVEDEEEGGISAAKKKKKKKKKKKAKTVTSDVVVNAEESPAPTPPTSPPPPASPSPKASPAPKPPVKKKPRVINPLMAEYDPMASQVSLTLGPGTAQSMHSYLSQQQAAEPKVKTKSRPGQQPEPPTEKRSLFTKLKQDVDGDYDVDEEDKGKEKNQWRGMLSGVKQKVSKTLRTIINPMNQDTGRGRKGMKWEEFERTMVKIGFEVDPAAAGSAVTFKPTNGKDMPISFHKPHPDTFIHHNMLIDMSNRLRRRYGWYEGMLEE